MLRMTLVNIGGTKEIADYECHVEITDKQRLKTLAKFKIKDFERTRMAQGLLLEAAYAFIDERKL